jgi:serine/threonine protein kinase/Tol biopolymer transport system component
MGKKLGVFEVSTLLGVGGMGEVYRARDTKLGREVAIKILPQEFANDRDRLARFQREARLLAALNHPNIAHIHELEEADGHHYLVMELVEGETLADRISRGPLPLEEIYKLFGQIAEGLEAAHQQGVIHRDLKPANIKITGEGKVSVLDFGLAKAAEIQRTATNDGVTSPWDDNSAGKSSLGQIVGTPAYMSPEQARGKVVDKRSDIWAFGCCLYEALTGQRSFQGETVSDTLAMILASEPDWKALPESTPPRLRELLRRCLAKDLRSRLCDIGDARLELSEIASNPRTASTAAALPAGAIVVRRSRFVAAIVGGLIVGSLAGAAIWNAIRPAPLPDQSVKSPQPVVRSTITLSPQSAMNIRPAWGVYSYAGGPRVALSPDGLYLVYTGGKEGETKLYLRPMAHPEQTRELPGTDHATSPFFKPDGQSVGFYAGRMLRKIRIDGSQPVPVCEVQNMMGASWGHDGMIYFAESGSPSSPRNRGLKRVRESGDVPAEPITHNVGDPNVLGHGWPCVLPDGKTVLFTLFRFVSAESSVAVLSLETNEYHEVIRNASFPRYLPTGHLLFYYRGRFNATRFDIDRLAVVGDRVPIVKSGFLPAVSENGCLVHCPPVAGETDDGLPSPRSLVWVDRDGKSERLNVPHDRYIDVRLSPAADLLAVEVHGERGGDIFVLDPKRPTPPKRLSSGNRNVGPVWTLDGNRVIFGSLGDGKFVNFYSAPADASAEPQRLSRPADDFQFPYSLSRDGTLAFVQIGSTTTGSDIYTLQLKGDDKAKPFRVTKFNETSPQFSPDGNWLAYVSDESGDQLEVFVRPYPPNGTDQRTQISDSGGTRPLWSRTGDELFYRRDSQLFAVKIETEPEFKAYPPVLVFEQRFGDTLARRGYDVSPDGKQFLFLELTEAEASQGPVDQLTVVQNWFEELKRLVPAGGGK